MNVMLERTRNQAVREQAIPFTISRNVPNEETKQAIEAIQELKKNHNKQIYSSFGELEKAVRNDEYLAMIDKSMAQLEAGKGHKHELIEVEDE